MIPVEAFKCQYALSSLFFPCHYENRSREKYKHVLLTHHMENSCPAVTQTFNILHEKKQIFFFFNFKPLFENRLLPLHKLLTLTIKGYI